MMNWNGQSILAMMGLSWEQDSKYQDQDSEAHDQDMSK